MSIFALFKIDVEIVVRFQGVYLDKRKKNVLTLDGNLLEHITRLCVGSSGPGGGGVALKTAHTRFQDLPWKTLLDLTSFQLIF